MSEEGNSTKKLIFWGYLFITSYPMYVFAKNRIAQDGGDRFTLAVGVLIVGVNLAVLWWLWLAAFTGDNNKKRNRR